jgi:hypothetical protein
MYIYIYDVTEHSAMHAMLKACPSKLTILLHHNARAQCHERHDDHRNARAQCHEHAIYARATHTRRQAKYTDFESFMAHYHSPKPTAACLACAYYISTSTRMKHESTNSHVIKFSPSSTGPSAWLMACRTAGAARTRA